MLSIIFIFLYIGLFTIGGGLVAIPLIQQQVVERGWITLEDFYSMVAIAQSTPGPIGINVATYVGFDQFGVFGALVATISFILPSFLIVSLIANLLRKHREKALVKNWFLYIKPAIVGLIGYSFIDVAEIAFIKESTSFSIDILSVILFVVLIGIYYLFRNKPWIVIIFGAVLGIIVF